MRTIRRAFALPLVGVVASSSVLTAQQVRYPDRTTVAQALPIKVSGLTPGTVALLRVEVVDAGGVRWTAQATFVADSAGTVDTDRDTAQDGSYRGRVPGGLFTHASPEDGDVGRRRFSTGDVSSVSTLISVEVGGEIVDSLRVVRDLVSPQVSVESIEQGEFRARLFVPGDPQGGGVVVLGGSEGGYPDGLAGLLAGQGYVTLSLPYFGVPGLPDELTEIPLESIVHASRWLARHPASAGRVALFGTSKGAEAALVTASLGAEVTGVVAYAPSSVAWSCICAEATPSSWTWQSEGVQAVPPGRDPSYDAAGGPTRPAVHYLFRKNRSPDVGVIRIERFSGPVLLVAGEDDQLWPSALMATELMARRVGDAGHAADQLLLYPEAGHLIGKAFLPSGATKIAGGRLETGGSPAGNALAQADAWPKVLGFLEKVLRERDGGVPHSPGTRLRH